MADPLDPGAPSCPNPLSAGLSGNDWPVGCGGWLRGVKKLPPSLPCGGDDPAHYRELHPEIALVHRELHATWTQQIEACARLWALPFTPNQLEDAV
jgi:hypothetical protein